MPLWLWMQEWGLGTRQNLIPSSLLHLLNLLDSSFSCLTSPTQSCSHCTKENVQCVQALSHALDVFQKKKKYNLISLPHYRFFKTFIVNIFKHIKKRRASSIMNMEMPISGSDVTKNSSIGISNVCPLQISRFESY